MIAIFSMLGKGELKSFNAKGAEGSAEFRREEEEKRGRGRERRREYLFPLLPAPCPLLLIRGVWGG
jgi:hypothetical protein